MSRFGRFWLLLVGLVTLAEVASRPATPWQPASDGALTTSGVAAGGEAVRWLGEARAVQAATQAHLRATDQPTCADASFVSYRRSDQQPTIADQWYVASQLWADVELVRATASHAQVTSGPDDEVRCHLAKGFRFLDRLRDGGGYYPRAALDGSDLARGVHYADDNALAGLTLLAAAEVESDPSARQAHLDAARAVATFLTTSGLWDGMFGGGFWWNSNKGDRWEGKPAQSNALAALFFARLAAVTDEDADRAWALRTIEWLDTVLYDPNVRLYRWSVRFEDMRNRTGGPILYDRYFNYDQAIAIEAQIAVARFGGRAQRLDRARDLGSVMHAALWNAERGGYNLEVGVNRIYASYGAWASFGHLALYDLDGDPSWLELAQRNADALDAQFRRPDGGYGWRHYRCATPTELSRPGCEAGAATWVTDQTRDGAAQAWMQHLQAAIARRLTHDLE